MTFQFSRRDFMKSTGALAALGVPSLSHAKQAAFDLDFAKLPERYWATPEIWTNPWEDWKVEDGELRNLRAEGEAKRVGRHRNVQCLTHELTGQKGWAELSLTFTLREMRGSAKEASTGFFVGIRQDDPAEEYRSRLIFGQGKHIGVNTHGEIFIIQNHRKKFPAIAQALKNKETLELRVRIESKGKDKPCTITASVLTKAGKELGAHTVDNIPGEWVIGNVGIVGNCPQWAAKVKPGGLWGFSRWHMAGPKLAYHPERAFGPILWTQYTVSAKVMKLTAQMVPIADTEEKKVDLQFRRNGRWETVASSEIIPLSWTAPFRVAGYEAIKDQPYRVRWVQRLLDGTEEEVFWTGTIRKEPVKKPVLDVALFTCFFDYLFPNRCVFENVARTNPDVLLFTGDQIYEPVGGWGIRRTGDLHEMCVNYLRKLALWGWSFREIMKDRPTVTMPDDHDVYHGNLWGASGRKITLEEWKSKAKPPSHDVVVGNFGGYVQPAEFVKAVERTQTSHLPDPASTKPLKQGITSYYTAMHYAGVGFAILEDRKFKSGPLAVAQHDGPRPDHILDPAAIKKIDVPDAKLLGDDQLAFLHEWAHDWTDHVMKVAVSQTLFCAAATHHGAYTNYLLGDMDSNGWPQQGRRRAVDALRRSGIFMLGGDQHLPTIIRHGLDRPGDAGISFCTPAGCTGYQRWWRPEEIGMKRLTGGRHGDRENTGCYRDGFGNIIDILAVGNPPESFKDAKSVEEIGFMKSAGWTLMKMDKTNGTLSGKAWRVKPGLDVRKPRPGDTFPGWPMTFAPRDAYGTANPVLPEVEVDASARTKDGLWPVVRVKDAKGAVVSSGRMYGPKYAPVVFEPGEYTVDIVDPVDLKKVLKQYKGVRTA